MRGKGILIDENYELQVSVQRDSQGRIISGLKIGNTLWQNQALILSLQPGEIKVSPMVGAGIDEIVNDNDMLGWRRKIREQLEMDGQTVQKIKINTKTIEIDANY